MFDKWQAQKWWAENFDKVMELYNVQQFNQQSVPLPTPPRSEDGVYALASLLNSWIHSSNLYLILWGLTSFSLVYQSSRIPSTKNGPATPPLNKESSRGKGYTSSGSLAHQPTTQTQNRHHDSSGLATTPKLSSISGTKTETSSVDESARSSSSREEEEEADHSGELSVSNASDIETEWVEQDEAGVYITIRALPDGTRELRRVRFR